MKLYSVYDKVAQRFNSPYSEVNDASAIRSFLLACQDSKSLLGMSSADFELCRLGEFDDATGSFALERSPVKIQDGRRVEDD